MNSSTTHRATNTRVHSGSIAVGDIVRTGWGTLHIIDREVASVERWWYNGYQNANLTFTNGDSETMWSGTIWPAIRD